MNLERRGYFRGVAVGSALALLGVLWMLFVLWRSGVVQFHAV